MQNRRQFIRKISVASGGSLCFATLSSTVLLQGCSTLDEYLITDPNDLNDTVVIVGGGITGLYAAFQFKKRKIPFKIFESSHRLGGKLLSNQNYEYGAFEFLNSDKNFLDLAKELSLKTEKLDAKTWTFKYGTQELVEKISERIAGVLPSRQIHFQSRLLSVNPLSSYFKLNFATEKNDKTYLSKKIFIALPVSDFQKINIAGNNLQDKNLTITDYIRVIVPHTKDKDKDSTRSGKKNGIDFSSRFHRGANHITLSASGQGREQLPQAIESIESWVSENVLRSNKLNLNLQAEHIYKWSDKSSTSSSNEIIESKNRAIVSDGLNSLNLAQNSRLESLLVHVNRHIDEFL